MPLEKSRGTRHFLELSTIQSMLQKQQLNESHHHHNNNNPVINNNSSEGKIKCLFITFAVIRRQNACVQNGGF